MDLLQVALIIVILVVAIMLSVLGIQVFLILRDLRKSLDKIEHIIEPKIVEVVEEGVKVVEETIKAVKPVTTPVVKTKSGSNSKRFFKRL